VFIRYGKPALRLTNSDDFAGPADADWGAAPHDEIVCQPDGLAFPRHGDRRPIVGVSDSVESRVSSPACVAHLLGPTVRFQCTAMRGMRTNPNSGQCTSTRRLSYDIA